MISVIVERAPGDKQGEAISDPLITANNVAIERGRNEIDSNFSNREAVTSTGPFVSYMRQGKLVQVADSEQQTWKGIIRNYAITIDSGPNTYSRIINLNLEREA